MSAEYISDRAYFYLLSGFASAGALTFGFMEHSSNESSLVSIVLSSLAGALSGIAVFASGEYTYQDFRRNGWR
jgi:hypothetical protein